KDEQELRDLLFSAIYHYPDAPIAIRYPRGFAQGVPKTPMKHIPLGKSETLKDGENLAILAFGKMVSYSIKVAEMLEKVGISAAVVNARFAKPLDKDMLKDVLSRFEFIVTVEEGQKIGGFGSAVLEFANNIGIKPNILVLGIEDKFIEHGTQEELLEEIGLEEKGIYKRIVDFLENNHQFAQNEKYYFTQK
ncbi:MAG TPA: transketolase C-terminal domain-containing protein, partial [Candidatus Kapabacteria bacterium]|nr:transketolase C-terminal domain-containing protein [Candidatus Kapabacteria bacterium]